MRIKSQGRHRSDDAQAKADARGREVHQDGDAIDDVDASATVPTKHKSSKPTRLAAKGIVSAKCLSVIPRRSQRSKHEDRSEPAGVTSNWQQQKESGAWVHL